jgi:hypothetical protein
MKIAAVLNDREVAVSGEGVESVETDDILVVRSEPREILDPDTQEVVGSITDVKAVVKVYEVQDRMLLARTFRQRKTNVGGSYANALSQLMSPPKWEIRTETLRRDRGRRDDLSEQDAVVRAGDPVETFDGEINELPTSSVWK